MGRISDAASFGFGSTLGGMGAWALFGAVALIGALLYVNNKAPGKSRTLKYLGIALIVLGVLPLLPVLVGEWALDQLDT